MRRKEVNAVVSGGGSQDVGKENYNLDNLEF
jgi:hypothetical protein